MMMQSALKGLRAASLKSVAARGFASEAFPSYVLNAPATEITTLDNGFRVASEGGHGETATVGVWIDAGSRYETEKNNGTAHFLEHITFKGTNKYTVNQLNLAIEQMGGSLNAYTSREQTVYYAQVFKKDVPQAVDILSDMLLNSKMSEESIEEERRVILREALEISHNLEEVLFDHLHATAYQNTGLGRTILGPDENIMKITRDDLQEYIDTHYTAPRMVLAGAGAIDHAQLVDLAQKSFGDLPSKPKNGAVVTNEPAIFTGSDIRIREDGPQYPLAHVALAVESAGWTDPQAFPLMVMKTLLGDWNRTDSIGSNSASLIGGTVAELDLAHQVMSFNTTYKDTGLFGVWAKAEAHGLQDLMFYTMDALVGLCHKVTDAQVERACNQLKAQMLLGLDSSAATCEEIGRHVLTYDRRITPAEAFARIDAVTTDSVKAAAQKFIEDQDVALAAIGPIHELPDYQWLRRRTYQLRY